jgi:hypothetical protein
LRVGEHLAQAFHDHVMRGVQIAAAVREQFYRVANAAWLVDAALFADRQVHRHVQKRVAAGAARRIYAGHGGIGIGKVGVPFGVLGNLAGGQRFDRFQRLVRLTLGPGGVEKTPRFVLCGSK